MRYPTSTPPTQCTTHRTAERSIPYTTTTNRLVWWRDGFPHPAFGSSAVTGTKGCNQTRWGQSVRSTCRRSWRPPRRSPVAGDLSAGEPTPPWTFGTMFAVQSTFRHLRYTSEHFHRLCRPASPPSPHNARPSHVSLLVVGSSLWTSSQTLPRQFPFLARASVCTLHAATTPWAVRQGRELALLHHAPS